MSLKDSLIAPDKFSGRSEIFLSGFGKRILNNPWATLLFVLGLSFSIHFPHFFNRELVLYDDQILVTRMQNVQSFEDYLQLYTSGRVIDRQPLRDLSHVVDWKLSRASGIWTFKWTQWIFWALCLCVFSRILVLISVTPLTHFLSVVFVSINPVTPIVSAWLGGRKHLLAVFLTLLATWLWLHATKHKGNTGSFHKKFFQSTRGQIPSGFEDRLVPKMKWTLF